MRLPSCCGMTRSPRPLILIALVCASLVQFRVAAQPPAGNELAPDDKTLSPYFVVEGGDPDLDRLPLKDTRVDEIGRAHV